MNMREILGAALNSSHLETQPHESAIDRVGALARSTSLGSALWRWGYAGDEAALGSCLKHLLRKAQRRIRVYKHHKDFWLLERVCKLVLYEWKHQVCLTCGGEGYLDADMETHGTRAKYACQQCATTGKKRYSDGERMSMLDIDPPLYSRWERNISDVWICLSGADAETGAICRDQLERTK